MIYRQAKLDDARAIVALNHKYCQAFFEGNKEKGFLKNKFSEDQIQTLIEQKEVVVAQMNENIIGYYLTNSLFENEAINKRKNIVLKLIDNGQIENVRYVLHTQAVVDKPYMGNGIARELLKKLKELVKPKFDLLIAYIDYENHNAKEAHLKAGWIIFTDTDNGCLVMMKVNEV